YCRARRRAGIPAVRPGDGRRPAKPCYHLRDHGLAILPDGRAHSVYNTPRMNKTLKILSVLAGLAVAAAGAAAGGAWYWAKKQPVPMDAERIDYVVEAGAGPRAIARSMKQAGI